MVKIKGVQVVALTAALVACPAVLPAAPGSDCSFAFVDDVDKPIEEALEICRADGAEQGCFEWEPGAGYPKVENSGEFFVEGNLHGPIRTELSPKGAKLCALKIPRKAAFSVEFDSPKTRLVTVSFYRTDRDPNLYRPQERVVLESPATLHMPAGAYLVSLAQRGLAPDLHLLKAAPGSHHPVRHRRSEGWSVAIQAAADSDSQPVFDAEVALRTIRGFDSETSEADGKARTLATRATDVDGWVVFSGLSAPLAGALVRHPEFLDAEIPAFSSDAGTFRVFSARLHQGGKLVVRTTGLEQVDLPRASKRPICGLFPPDTSDEKAFHDSLRLIEMKTDAEGVCRASRIPGGSYALKVSIPGVEDAYTVEPVFIIDDQTTLTTMELRPIHISGRVYKGSEGAPGYDVTFGRAEDFPGGGPVFPVGKPARTDAEGNYELTLWSAGRYLAMVSNSTSIAGIPQTVDIDRDDSFDFEVSSAAIEGRVVDELEEPIPEAKVRVRLGGLTRNVLLDDEGRFEVPFDSETEGTAELMASAAGFFDSDPLRVEVRAGVALDPVEMRLQRRKWRSGRLVLASGIPASGAWVNVHRLGSPLQYIPTVERVVAASDGTIEIPRASEKLRLFFGGAGCPLGSYDLAPWQDSALEAGDGEFLVTCGEPGHLMIRLVSDDPELKDRVPIILRKDGVTIPDSALQNHLTALGLPTVTDGQGRLGLVALEAGAYELFHGKMTSSLNVAGHADMALLSKVHLDARATIELEAVVDLR